jgi:hypothetical protein
LGSDNDEPAEGTNLGNDPYATVPKKLDQAGTKTQELRRPRC